MYVFIKFCISNKSTNLRKKSGKREKANVKLIVYDILGREVATLVNEKQRHGNYEVKFDARNITSGIYFYKISSGSYTEVKKMILLK
ncbi:MAG: T9SS type A sorting domain-containing protein [Ignavibacteriae bacterium]|nr:T9SS type A sorting domain-containing protein [Ignavibacteriota bacterium]MCB9208201.1 T9SS type A sorting domain-containing protein [Ignavibacteriales bacterium]